MHRFPELRDETTHILRTFPGITRRSTPYHNLTRAYASEALTLHGPDVADPGAQSRDSDL